MSCSTLMTLAYKLWLAPSHNDHQVMPTQTLVHIPTQDTSNPDPIFSHYSNALHLVMSQLQLCVNPVFPIHVYITFFTSQLPLTCSCVFWPYIRLLCMYVFDILNINLHNIVYLMLPLLVWLILSMLNSEFVLQNSSFNLDSTLLSYQGYALISGHQKSVILEAKCT